MLSRQKYLIQDFKALVKSPEIEVIAFDIYDTLLTRKVLPEQMHYLWAQNIKKNFSLKKSEKEIVSKKFQAMKIVKLKNVIKGKDREYEYADMLYILYKIIKINIDFHEFARACLEIEEKLEKEMCYRYEKGFELYRIACNSRVKLICISDFYLSKTIVKNVMIKNGYHFDDIFISCDFLLSKRSGRLYQKVSKQLECKPVQMLMIGDNEHSDYCMAKKQGMKAICISHY